MHQESDVLVSDFKVHHEGFGAEFSGSSLLVGNFHRISMAFISVVEE